MVIEEQYDFENSDNPIISIREHHLTLTNKIIIKINYYDYKNHDKTYVYVSFNTYYYMLNSSNNNILYRPKRIILCSDMEIDDKTVIFGTLDELKLFIRKKKLNKLNQLNIRL